MAQWKMVMGSYKTTLKGFPARGIPEREETIYVILTNDNLQLLLREYVESDNEKFDLEIDGKYYKRQGSVEKSAPDYPLAVKMFQKYWGLYSPKEDIISPLKVVKLYEALHEEAKELYSLG